jgi:hypothetical protein
MKYSELPKKWQKVALRREIKWCQEVVNQIAKEERVRAWEVTKDSQEVKDSIELDREYALVKDDCTDRIKLDIL